MRSNFGLPQPFRRGLISGVIVLALGLGAAPLATLTAVAAVPFPTKFTDVTSKPGPGVGETTISWTQDGKNTTGYSLETGLTTFSSTSTSLPDHGRNSKVFTVSGVRKSWTLTAAQTASAGAAAGTANHLYFRLQAINKTSAGTQPRNWPYLETAAIRPPNPATTGTKLRTGTFNVRTARATTDSRTWLQRAPDVAKAIVAASPGVMGLQELGPGRADGSTVSQAGAERQTDSLIRELKANGGSKYKLVRTTAYVSGSTLTDTQGMRLLYDANSYTQVTSCPDSSTAGNFSDSCSIKLPLRPSGDTEANRRRAVYAEFVHKASGTHFFYVSVHLDARSSDNAATDATYNALRGEQAKTASAFMDKLNTKKLPIIFVGDFNTWQSDRAGYTAHDVLMANGYYDTAAAITQVDLTYTTSTGFATTVEKSPSGYGARLDAILVKGVIGASYWENVMKVTDPARPSDHNLVIADIMLPFQTPPSTKYQPLTPARLLDTRSGLGAPKALVGAGKQVDLVVTGRGGVPLTGASAVVLNVTVTQPAVGGYATVFPAGVTRPNASTINFPPGKTIANSVIVKVGTGGKVSLYVSGATHLIADVQGWFPTGSSLNSQTPVRILDTRNGTGAPVGAVPAGGTVELTVAGKGGVPATGVGAVVLNVTATQGSYPGYTTVYPTGVSTRPEAYTVSYPIGTTVAGGTVAKVGSDGKVILYASAGVHLLVDVQGWFPSVGDVTALTPSRVLDTRSSSSGQVPAGGTVDVTVLGAGGVPATGVSAVVLTVTATDGAGGFVTAYPAGVTRPVVSTLNPTAGETIGNSVVVKVGAGGKVTLYAHGATHLVADVVAYIKT